MWVWELSCAVCPRRGFLNIFCWGTLRLRQFSRMHIWKVRMQAFRYTRRDPAIVVRLFSYIRWHKHGASLEWNFDIDRVSESREQCAAQAILVFQNSYLVNLGIGKRRAVCQFPFRLSVLRRPTTAPSPPIVIVVFLSRFVFGVTPFGDPWSLGTQLRGLTVPAGDF